MGEGGVMSVALREQLAEHNRLPLNDGACRLLRTLVRQGLPERALLPAAALVAELELEAADARERGAGR